MSCFKVCKSSLQANNCNYTLSFSFSAAQRCWLEAIIPLTFALSLRAHLESYLSVKRNAFALFGVCKKGCQDEYFYYFLQVEFFLLTYSVDDKQIPTGSWIFPQNTNTFAVFSSIKYFSLIKKYFLKPFSKVYIKFGLPNNITQYSHISKPI